MKNQLLTSREFVRNFAEITRTKTPTQYTILRRGKPLGSFIPFPHNQKHVTFEDLKKLRFRSHEKNLSQQIDAIVYGAERT